MKECCTAKPILLLLFLLCIQWCGTGGMNLGREADESDGHI